MKKTRNLFMNLTLMCSFFIFTFQFDQEEIVWQWSGQEFIPIILGISALIFGISWYWAHNKYSKLKS